MLQRIMLLAVSLAAALGALLSGASRAHAALTFVCVEPSRYEHLLVIFNDDPNVFFEYFKPRARRVPNLKACRALSIYGTIGPGDAELMLRHLLGSQGGIATVHLAFDGSDAVEEAAMALIIREFGLRTFALRAATYTYWPDFASRWHEPVRLGRSGTAPPAAVAPFAALDAGLVHYFARKDLVRQPAKKGSHCQEGCWPVWAAGIHRSQSANPPREFSAVPESADAKAARRRAALAFYLDNGRWPAANDAVLQAALSGAPQRPAENSAALRKACATELSIVQSLADSIVPAVEAAAVQKTEPPAISALASPFERLNRAGARLNQCYAVAAERERAENFRRQCTPKCDLPALIETFRAKAAELTAEASRL